MPFKVRFKFYEPGKEAPCFETTDRQLAEIERHERLRKGLPTRIVPEITCVGLTKPEEYVFLVYRCVQAIRKYYDERNHVSKDQSTDNLRVSLALEKELDGWNIRTRFYLQGHPKSRPDSQEAFAFFQIVEAWRNRWHEYHRYKKKRDKDPKWEKKLRDDCFAIESEIRKYVNLVIGL